MSVNKPWLERLNDKYRTIDICLIPSTKEEELTRIQNANTHTLSFCLNSSQLVPFIQFRFPFQSTSSEVFWNIF